MTRKFGFDLLQEQIIDRVASELAAEADIIEKAGNYGDTPIEKLLLGAMFLSLKHLKQDIFTQIVTMSDETMAKRRGATLENPGFFVGHNTFFVQKQTDVAGWRADFVFNIYATWRESPESGRKPGWDRLIVECDGHDFHERTKEQAARDRERDRNAQLEGIEIFRFTGSELWRDPLGCCDQIVKWANKRI
jgi:hypothetical protein